MDGDSPRQKIFPRNLTARAAAVVPGNPVVSRPESGADNSHPGLEFDQRNLDRGFFPGLLFDFQFGVGARLVEVQEQWPEMKAALAREKDAAAAPDGGFFLWYVAGLFGRQPGKATVAELYGLDGYEVLRQVHDLENGPLAVVIGRHPDTLNGDNVEAWMGGVKALLGQVGPLISDEARPGPARSESPKLETKCVTFRDRDNVVQVAVFTGERAPYLSEDGVIELHTVEPGGLTRSLCSPWQWDFADCGCYYWAASRPDIVSGEAPDAPPELNYLRRRGRAAPPVTDPPVTDPRRTWKGWMKGVMTGADMIEEWERLPMVINDRESAGTVRLAAAPPKENVWDRARVIEELRHLATVEHTLCVKFLYAYYSVDAPKGEPPPGTTGRPLARAQVANEVVKIAIDEMRHFRWVNEALVMLGEQPVFGRASKLRNPEPGAEIAEPQPSLKLEGLTPEALQRFIDIERPSPKEDPREVASLYKNILVSLQSGEGNYRTRKGEDVRERVQELVKLIIDEGRDHFNRAEHAQRLLKGDHPRHYLRYETAPVRQGAGTEAGQLQRLGDHYYRAVLQILKLAFRAEPDARATMLKQTRRVMHNLDEVGHALGSQHRAGLLFTLSSRRRPDKGAPQAEARPSPLALGTSVPRILTTLRGSPSAEVAEIARRHAQEASDLVHFFAAAGDPAKGP